MNIDNKIHFIWMGKVIPENYAIGILEHLDLNYKNYTVGLWTDKPRENREQFARMLCDKRFKKGRVKAADVTRTEDVQGRLILNFEYAADRGNPFTKKTKNKTLSFINIRALNAACGSLKARYKDALAVRNFGRASDVLRLVILREEGGIYMDTDVESIKPLPAAIDAPDGFLMGYGQAGMQSFTNAVMAASTQSNFVPELIRSIQFTFRFFDEKNWWSVNNRNILRTRADLRTAQSSALADKTDLQGARTRYQKAMENGTLAVTGPTKVELFLYKRMLGAEAEDPLVWMAKMMPDVDRLNPDKFNEVMGQFKLLVAKPKMVERGVVSRYSFPMDCIKIRSDASWM